MMRVGLAQINIDLSWSQRYRILPYSIALLQAAVAASRDDVEFAVPIDRRMPVEEAVARLSGCDVAGFSSYVWNERLSLAVARELKRRRPDVLVVFGGPQVPDHPEAFLREHPFVDVACHGEGEGVFAEVLERAPARDFAGVAGVSYVDDGGAFHTFRRRPRIARLDGMPSPFLEGAFDPLIASCPDDRWVMPWETNRGCPFSCTFCDWGSATAAKVYRFDMDRLAAEVEWMAANRIEFVFCCDANFGMLRRDHEIAQMVVDCRARTGYPRSFSVQNTKNATERAYAVQSLLATSLNTHGVTISLQSANAGTLEAIRRTNISSDSFRELQRRFATDGVYTYSDLILGLPDESYAAFAGSVTQVVADGQHNHVQFHNCSVLPNAEMGDPEYIARWGLETVAQPLRSLHAPVDEDHDVEEYLDTVIATAAMPRPDWVRAKVFAWLADLLYFDRTLQIPMLLVAQQHGVDTRAVIEAVMDAGAAEHPVVARVARSMTAHALAIQAGGVEYVPAPAWGGVLWPADQYALVELVAGGAVDDFYAEAQSLLTGLLAGRGIEHDELLLDEAFRLNRALLRLPGDEGAVVLALSHDLLRWYLAAVKGAPDEPAPGLSVCRIDRDARPLPTLDAWLEHIMWAQNKDKRGYLHAPASPHPAQAPPPPAAVARA
jgi:radical SAM superfamily enzyme YgiQ (UPF0313 family)